jgi:hypothetical protein
LLFFEFCDSKGAYLSSRTMPKKRKNSHPEILSRSVEFSSHRMSVGLRAVRQRGVEPYIESKPWLELKGTASEPVRDVKDVVISLYPEEQPAFRTYRPASCGAIVQVRPQLHFVLTWPHVDFDRVWAMAVAGHLRHAYIAFTKPHYGSGLVVNASFSNEVEE